jgi:Spy/CpxP family protein refolding chaperone
MFFPYKEAIMLRDKTAFVVVMTALLALLLALVTGCCYRHRTPEQRAEHVVRHLVKTLKLDAVQTEKLEKIKGEFLAKQAAIRTAREESIKEAREMMMSPQIDQATLNAHIEKRQAQANDLIRFVSAKFVEIHDMLTPEQRSKLAGEMEKYASRAHHW